MCVCVCECRTCQSAILIRYDQWLMLVSRASLGLWQDCAVVLDHLMFVVEGFRCVAHVASWLLWLRSACAFRAEIVLVTEYGSPTCGSPVWLPMRGSVDAWPWSRIHPQVCGAKCCLERHRLTIDGLYQDQSQAPADGTATDISMDRSDHCYCARCFQIILDMQFDMQAQRCST